MPTAQRSSQSAAALHFTALHFPRQIRLWINKEARQAGLKPAAFIKALAFSLYEEVESVGDFERDFLQPRTFIFNSGFEMVRLRLQLEAGLPAAADIVSFVPWIIQEVSNQLMTGNHASGSRGSFETSDSPLVIALSVEESTRWSRLAWVLGTTLAGFFYFAVIAAMELTRALEVGESPAVAPAGWRFICGLSFDPSGDFRTIAAAAACLGYKGPHAVRSYCWEVLSEAAEVLKDEYMSVRRVASVMSMKRQSPRWLAAQQAN
jgi:hypothetical protein